MRCYGKQKQCQHIFVKARIPRPARFAGKKIVAKVRRRATGAIGSSHGLS